MNSANEASEEFRLRRLAVGKKALAFLYDDSLVWVSGAVCRFSNSRQRTYIYKFFDGDQRPELLYGAYEIKAPSMFADKQPQPPTFIFFLDVSLQASQSGFFHQSLSSIKL